jgi:hypothetical protein
LKVIGRFGGIFNFYFHWHVPLKCRLNFNGLQGVMLQKMQFFITTDHLSSCRPSVAVAVESLICGYRSWEPHFKAVNLCNFISTCILWNLISFNMNNNSPCLVSYVIILSNEIREKQLWNAVTEADWNVKSSSFHSKVEIRISVGIPIVLTIVFMPFFSSSGDVLG